MAFAPAPVRSGEDAKHRMVLLVEGSAPLDPQFSAGKCITKGAIMQNGKSLFGIPILLAIAVGGVGPQPASAASNTAYTCTNTGTFTGENWTSATCTTHSPTGTFGHVAIPANTSTTLTGTGGTTKLASTISGVAVELQSTSLQASGSMENTVHGGEMLANATGTITYAGVTVTKPAGKGCIVWEELKGGELKNEGMISTKLLKASTAGLTGALSFTPNEGSTLATFWVSRCSLAALNGEYVVTGSVTSTEIAGTSTKFTHENTTGQKTLKLRGQVAGLEGELNLLGNGTPLALT
jgi:hypothetical protein